VKASVKAWLAAISSSTRDCSRLVAASDSFTTSGRAMGPLLATDGGEVQGNETQTEQQDGRRFGYCGEFPE
jgi:hypothetical protein